MENSHDQMQKLARETQANVMKMNKMLGAIMAPVTQHMTQDQIKEINKSAKEANQEYTTNINELTKRFSNG